MTINKIMGRWIKDANEGRIHIGKRELTNNECALLVNAFQCVAADLDSAMERHDATERIWCMQCGKSVSTPVPKDTILRAWVECPECIEKKATKVERREVEIRLAHTIEAKRVLGTGVDNFKKWLDKRIDADWAELSKEARRP